MPNSDFFTDPYSLVSRPWEHEILNDWMVQYFRFLKVSPEVIGAMKERADEFEMVPVPKSISQKIKSMPLDLRHGGTASVFTADPFSMSSGDTLRSKVETVEKLRNYPVLVDLMRSFIVALEAENIDAALSFVSDDYVDASGRDKSSLKKALTGLKNSSSKRRVILVHADQYAYIDGMIIARVTGAWEATLGKEGASSSEFFALELIFAHDKKGEWKIRSIKHE